MGLDMLGHASFTWDFFLAIISIVIIDIILAANEEGKTVITATHDLHIVEEISDKVYVLGRERRINRSSPARELLEDIEFLKENNLVHIHSHRHKDKVHIHPHLHHHEQDHHFGDGSLFY
mgnify:CR=1 FL=1